MNTRPKLRYHGRTRLIQALCALMLGTLTTIFAAQEGNPLPRVVSAQVPMYPRILRSAQVEGVVRLQVTTNGKRVASIKALSGPPMLEKAATENVETWEFAGHHATTFETTFKYRLSETVCDKYCNCDSLEDPVVLLRLPAEVELIERELFICHNLPTHED